MISHTSITPYDEGRVISHGQHAACAGLLISSMLLEVTGSDWICGGDPLILASPLDACTHLATSLTRSLKLNGTQAGRRRGRRADLAAALVAPCEQPYGRLAPDAGLRPPPTAPRAHVLNHPRRTPLGCARDIRFASTMRTPAKTPCRRRCSESGSEFRRVIVLDVMECTGRRREGAPRPCT